MHAAALGVTPIVTFLRDSGDERRIMRAASVGWVVSGGDNGAYACLDFMALRVPVIAERSPLTQHYVADGITGILLVAGRSVVHRVAASRRFSPAKTSAWRWGTRPARARSASSPRAR